jgi:hypothetical protein
MPLSFPPESPYHANGAQSRDGAVYHGFGRYQGDVHGENRAKVPSHLAITQSGHEVSHVTRTARHLVSLPIRNSRERKVMRA